jgi:hypothetical protein
VRFKRVSDAGDRRGAGKVRGLSDCGALGVAASFSSLAGKSRHDAGACRPCGGQQGQEPACLDCGNLRAACARAKATAFLTPLTGGPPQVAYRQYTGVFAASIPRHVELFMEKQLRDDKPNNIFTFSRALNFKHVLPVLFQDLLPGYISRYNAPSAASLGAFAF